MDKEIKEKVTEIYELAMTGLPIQGMTADDWNRHRLFRIEAMAKHTLIMIDEKEVATPKRHCGRCHDCGVVLKEFNGTEWCRGCVEYKYYWSHGVCQSDIDSPEYWDGNEFCPEPVKEVRNE